MIKKQHINRGLLIFIMVVLLLPLFQECTDIFTEKPLMGFVYRAKKPKTSLENWWNGTYQDSFELFHNEQFGLRNELVYLHNQIEFDLFKNVSVKGIVIGKNDYLYEKKYITAYNGEDFIGNDAIISISQKLKILQDTLAKRNITLIVAFAPGKASFYPEYIPDELNKPGKQTNYKSFTHELHSAGVNMIDFNKWLISQKESSPCLLYPKTGIHWSRYGSTLAMDSLIHYIEVKRSINMPSLMLKGFAFSDSIHWPDDDIGLSLNLIYPIQPLLMGYPDYSFENTNDKAKVRMMVISDSFFWSIFDVNLAPRSFESIDFWYYNQQVYHSDGRPKEDANEIDNCIETEEHDVVMIFASEPNLGGLGWGYIEDAYDYFVLKKTDRVINKMVRMYESKIRMDQAWLMTIKAKAESAKIPLDSMIHMDAVYLAEKKRKK